MGWAKRERISRKRSWVWPPLDSASLGSCQALFFFLNLIALQILCNIANNRIRHRFYLASLLRWLLIGTDRDQSSELFLGCKITYLHWSQLDINSPRAWFNFLKTKFSQTYPNENKITQRIQLFSFINNIYFFSSGLPNRSKVQDLPLPPP